MTGPPIMPATTDPSTLHFGPWYRRSPFLERTLAAGCSADDIDDHMDLPGYCADPIEEARALLDDVTMWDVSVELWPARTATSPFIGPTKGVPKTQAALLPADQEDRS